MKKILWIAVFLLTSPVWAGPGHGHSHGHSHSHREISKKTTVKAGKYHIKKLIEAKKIDPSWKDAKHASSEKKKFGHRTEWVAIFTNKKGVKGKKLYVFMKLSGNFVAANFTGK